MKARTTQQTVKLGSYLLRRYGTAKAAAYLALDAPWTGEDRLASYEYHSGKMTDYYLMHRTLLNEALWAALDTVPR